MAEQVDVVSPEGKLVNIPDNELEIAQAQGYRAPTSEDYRNYKNNEVADSTAGKLASFSGSALNTMTFGASDAAIKAYAPKEYVEALDRTRKVNPNSSMAGTATGLGLSVGLGGGLLAPVTEAGQVAGRIAEGAVGAGKLATVAGKTAQFATEGTLLAMPSATIKASIGDYEAAGETLAFGGATGGALGLGVGFLPMLLKSAGTGLSKASDTVGGVTQPVKDYLYNSSKYFESNQGGKILGLNKAIRNKMGNSRADELVEWADKKGLMQGFKSTTDLAETVSTLKEEAGKEIGKIVKAIDSTGKNFVDTNKLMNTLRTGIEVPEGQLLSAERNTYEKAMEDISSALLDRKGEAKFVKLNVLQDLRKKLGDYAYKDFGQVRPGRDIVAEMRKVIDNAMGESIEFAEKTIPEQASRWKAAKSDYRNYSDLIKPLENQISSTYGNQYISPSGFGSMIVGSQVDGVKGAIGGYVTNSLRQQYGAQLAYKTVSTINRAIENRNKTISQAVGSFLGESTKLPRRLVADSETLTPTSLGILNNYINEKRSTRAETVDQFNQELASELSNPGKFQERLASMTGGMANLDPELGAGVYDKLIFTAKYLQDKAPKGMNIPTALSPARFVPSDRDISSYERRVRAAVNPYSLLLDLNKGILSPEAMETVKDLYPSFYGQVSKELVNQGTASKATIPYAKRLQVSALLGTQLDRLSVKTNQDALQKNFVAEQEQQQAKLQQNSKIADNTQTDIQRISNK